MDDTKSVAKKQTHMSNIATFFNREDVRKKFEEMLGKRAPQFITSVLQIVSNNEMLKNADPISVYNAAAVAATLDLPINNNLGFAYIVPYNDRKSGKQIAQFQMGYKGFIQLAQRSGQFQTISAKPVYEGQLVDDASFDGFILSWKDKTSDKVIGYASYFRLLNGFEKVLYMSMEDLKKHGMHYSQSYRNEKSRPYSLWETDLDAMATKTVLKLLLSKFAPLSIEMQKAVITDQAVITGTDITEIEYVDNVPELEEKPNKERDRLASLITDCKTKVELTNLADKHMNDIEEMQLTDLFDEQKNKVK